MSTTTPTTAIAPSIESFSDSVDCDFETFDFCGYIQKDFHRNSMLLGTQNTGFYANCVVDQCTLSKKFTNYKKNLKFRFENYLNGDKAGSFLVLKKDNETVWSNSDYNKFSWKKGVINFPLGTFTVNSISILP